MARQTNIERFWSKVNKTEHCWEWLGSINRCGYGWFFFNKKMTLAHRYAYLIANGDPGNLCVLHRCDNPKCVRLEHLFLGTRTDNNADTLNKGRQKHGVVDGSKHPSAKLTEQIAVSIRERYASGVAPRSLAEEFGVSRATIWRVIHRCAWKCAEERTNGS